MFPLRVLGYNPLSLNNENRFIDVLEETSRFDFTMLAGTGMPHKGGVITKSHAGATCFSSGYKHSSMCNRSCGVAIVVGKSFRNARFHEPVEAPGKILGR